MLSRFGASPFEFGRNYFCVIMHSTVQKKTTQGSNNAILNKVAPSKTIDLNEFRME